MKDLPVPRARTKDLVIEDLPDETLVYDFTSDKAHCLNRTTASVWSRCDGIRTVPDLVKELEKEMKAPIDERLVRIALDQLSSRNLLDGTFKMPPALAGLNRRQLMHRLGLAGVVALPVITSLLAPTPAHAQSGCVPNGSPCSPTGPPCCNPSSACFGIPSTCNFSD